MTTQTDSTSMTYYDWIDTVIDVSMSAPFAQDASILCELYAHYDDMLEQKSVSTEELDNPEKNAETFDACIPWEFDPFDTIL